MVTHAIGLIAILLPFGELSPGCVLHHASGTPAAQLQPMDDIPGLPLKNEALSKKSYALGLEYKRRGDLRRAFEFLTTAIEFDPDNALAYAARSNVRSMRGDHLGAIGDADYAIGLDPTLAVAYYNRGLIHARLRMWASAADDFSLAAFLDPDLENGLAFDNLGLALLAQERFSEAIASFSRAIGRNSLPALSYFNRSRAYERSGQLDAAISDMNATIQLVPRYAEFYHRRADLFLRRGIESQALLDLTIALDLDPDDLHARADRALLHERLGNTVAAQDDFRRFAERSGDDPRKLDRTAHFNYSR